MSVSGGGIVPGIVTSARTAVGVIPGSATPYRVAASTALLPFMVLASVFAGGIKTRRPTCTPSAGIAAGTSVATVRGPRVPPAEDGSRARTVGLPPATVTLLRRHRKSQLERRVLLGEAWQDFDLVIERGDGGPFAPDSLSRDWYRLMRRIGLPGLRLHDLRHAFATRLLEASVHPKVVNEALGHSSVSFTMDTYQHLMPTMQDAATQAIEEALGATIGGTVAAETDTS
jgi:Phage integrase family